jgi:hypothetical protein
MEETNMEWEMIDWLSSWVAKDKNGNKWFVLDNNDVAYLNNHEISLFVKDGSEQAHINFPYLPSAKAAMEWVENNYENYAQLITE